MLGSDQLVTAASATAGRSAVHNVVTKNLFQPKPNYVPRALINRNAVVIWKELEGMHRTPATSAPTIDIVS